jgi:hypothetical protein
MAKYWEFLRIRHANDLLKNTTEATENWYISLENNVLQRKIPVGF